MKNKELKCVNNSVYYSAWDNINLVQDSVQDFLWDSISISVLGDSLRNSTWHSIYDTISDITWYVQ